MWVLGTVDRGQDPRVCSLSRRSPSPHGSTIANTGLDEACTTFGRDLKHDLRDDTTSERCGKYFDLSVSRFVKRAFRTQVDRVLAWLRTSDPMLEKNRPDLERWAARSEQCIVADLVRLEIATDVDPSRIPRT